MINNKVLVHLSLIRRTGHVVLGVDLFNHSGLKVYYVFNLVGSLPKPNQTTTVTYLFCYHDSYLLCKKANAERSTCQLHIKLDFLT